MTNIDTNDIVEFGKLFKLGVNLKLMENLIIFFVGLIVLSVIIFLVIRLILKIIRENRPRDWWGN